MSEFKIEHIREEIERVQDGEVTASDASSYLEFHFKKATARIEDVRLENLQQFERIKELECLLEDAVDYGIGIEQDYEFMTSNDFNKEYNNGDTLIEKIQRWKKKK